MKKIIFLLFAYILVISCNENEKVDLKYVTSQFEKNSKDIERVEYNVQRIDSFPDGDVWNNRGYALLEKDENDEIFGYSFYGKRNDDDKEYLYDNGNGFVIKKDENSYKLIYPNGMLGSSGGQMVVEDIFHLDSIYKNAELIEEENKYIIKYIFEPDTVYDITNRIKIVELRKNDFFPTNIIYYSKKLGKNTSTQHILSDIKINETAKGSISEFKNVIASYEVIQPINQEPNKILNKEFPKIELVNLIKENDKINVEIDKLTLIDFWEVWCSPCIKSFPKVEKLKQKYSENLQVIGIVSQNREDAKKIVENKQISFTNLIGNKDILEKYGVNSYPRYFLVDKNGIIKKEYHGFSENIEKDIQTIISE